MFASSTNIGNSEEHLIVVTRLDLLIDADNRNQEDSET